MISSSSFVSLLVALCCYISGPDYRPWDLNPRGFRVNYFFLKSNELAFRCSDSLPEARLFTNLSPIRNDGYNCYVKVGEVLPIPSTFDLRYSSRRTIKVCYHDSTCADLFESEIDHLMYVELTKKESDSLRAAGKIPELPVQHVNPLMYPLVVLYYASAALPLIFCIVVVRGIKFD